ncbi:hypothetical protein RRG08_049984 [Elysia crispata]|uniref:Uncharacterized protein n=1 Tax=Elysia crispata TaxID=231223 RepID=A0AAE1EC24_9GAST|nr:hypothetical protein RRG08_049984 [Elysia crispata]
MWVASSLVPKTKHSADRSGSIWGRGQLAPDAPCKQRSLLTQCWSRSGKKAVVLVTKAEAEEESARFVLDTRTGAESGRSPKRGVLASLRPLVNIIGGHFTPGGCRVRFITWTNDHFEGLSSNASPLFSFSSPAPAFV